MRKTKKREILETSEYIRKLKPKHVKTYIFTRNCSVRKMFHYNTNTDNETTLIQRRKKESVSSFIGEIKQLSPRTVFLTQLKCG